MQTVCVCAVRNGDGKALRCVCKRLRDGLDAVVTHGPFLQELDEFLEAGPPLTFAAAVAAKDYPMDRFEMRRVAVGIYDDSQARGFLAITNSASPTVEHLHITACCMDEELLRRVVQRATEAFPAVRRLYIDADMLEYDEERRPIGYALPVSAWTDLEELILGMNNDRSNFAVDAMLIKLFSQLAARSRPIRTLIIGEGLRSPAKVLAAVAAAMPALESLAVWMETDRWMDDFHRGLTLEQQPGHELLPSFDDEPLAALSNLSRLRRVAVRTDRHDVYDRDNYYGGHYCTQRIMQPGNVLLQVELWSDYRDGVVHDNVRKHSPLPYVQLGPLPEGVLHFDIDGIIVKGEQWIEGTFISDVVGEVRTGEIRRLCREALDTIWHAGNLRR